MKFCVATVSFWESIGFDTEHWRKSLDGTKAICHEKFAEVLIHDIKKNQNIKIYTIDSKEFEDMLKQDFIGEEIMEEDEHGEPTN